MTLSGSGLCKKLFFTCTHCLILNLIKPKATLNVRVSFSLKNKKTNKTPQRFGGYLFIYFLLEILLPGSLSLLYFGGREEGVSLTISFYLIL